MLQKAKGEHYERRMAYIYRAPYREARMQAGETSHALYVKGEEISAPIRKHKERASARIFPSCGIHRRLTFVISGGEEERMIITSFG